jgi:hypothetical protein
MGPWQVEANRRGILREGGVRGLVGALAKHTSREFVVHGACRALGQLIFDNPRTAQVRTHPPTRARSLRGLGGGRSRGRAEGMGGGDGSCRGASGARGAHAAGV